MKNVMRLHATKYLTEQQVLTAARFARDPNRFKLSPTMFRVLRQIVIEERPLEELEKERGWPSRSAKAILSLILYSLEESDGLWWEVKDDDDEEISAREKLAWVCGTDVEDQVQIVKTYGLTVTEAQIYLILDRAEGKTLSKETILRRMYSTSRSTDEMPSEKVIDVLVCKLRAKLEAGNAACKIETLWGLGYRMERETVPKP